MKRLVLVSLLAAAVGVMAFLGCEKPEDIEIPVASKPQTTDSSVINTQPTNMANQQTTDTTNQQIADTTNSQSVIHNTELSYTGCHSSQSKGPYDPIISTSYETNTLLLMIENLRVNCGLDSLSVVSEIDAQTIIVNIRQICENQTNCTCPIDVNYSIDNIKPGNYELIIIKSGLTIYTEEMICE